MAGITFVKFNQNHYVTIISKNKLKNYILGICIVGCVTNFVRLIITRESPCILIYNCAHLQHHLTGTYPHLRKQGS
jgi:hypothetical protein